MIGIVSILANIAFLVGEKSKVTLFHDDDILQFVNMDETHHELGNEGKKGGSTTVRYKNPTFSCAGDRVTKSSRYTNGVYSTNPLEVLPPLYIFDTKSKDASNYKINPEWCKGLPKVVGKFGRNKKELWN